MSKPIILIGGGGSILGGGTSRISGGCKLYNLWVKLLINNGYETYQITNDGKYGRWLIEHQPVISFDLAKKWAGEGRDLKCMTGWIPVAKYFLILTEQIYFYDCEIAYTSGRYLPFLKELMKSKIRAVATNSHYNQKWYKETFNYPAKLVPEWSDEKYWHPKPEKRQKNLVGYMLEPGAKEVIRKINETCRNQGISLNFMNISGNEQEVLDKMQQCDFYIGTNPGKHPTHGEGCPRSQQEAMHAGCIPIAYDVKGNREYLTDGETGFLVPLKRVDLLTEKLIYLARNPEVKEQIRTRSIDFALKKFSSPGRWEPVKNFLELE